MTSFGLQSPADLLAEACWNSDYTSAYDAIADGASVNEQGAVPGCGSWLPLAAAVVSRACDYDMCVWLVACGADPNGDAVMYYAAGEGTAGMLQLLIDAGGDVNRRWRGKPPLFRAVDDDREDKVRVLLVQPSLDLTVQVSDKTPEQYAQHQHKPALADMIAQEVSVDWGRVHEKMTI